MQKHYQISELPSAVRSLVERTQEEFEYLAIRRDHLSSQITKLSSAIRALQGVFELDASSDADPGILDEGFNCEAESDIQVEDPISSLELRRACRIALMESEGPASCQEVHNRILRRGSYDLSEYKDPAATLSAALMELALAGEAQVLRHGLRTYWQRIALPRCVINIHNSVPIQLRNPLRSNFITAQ